MRRNFIAAALLFSLIFSVHAFSQTAFGTIGGTVSDATGALIPGVTVTATNTDTGIVATALTNEAGIYNFVSLQPGKFKMTAALTGFQTAASEVPLGNDSLRLNFTLKIGSAAATTVEIITSVDSQIAQSSPSIGEVLSQQKVVALPLVTNNVLDLIGTMSGVNVTNSAIFGANQTTFAGLDATNINVRVNGVTSNAGGRYPTGIQTATMINPDMVGEIKLILTPVDAETGDGNGQIQIQTRSGTNKYSGSVVGYTKNTALNANTWSNNRVQPTATKPDWSNIEQVTASYGGPIIKNKTFFFALYDGVIAHTRTSTNPVVLTPCARNGIFRYWDTGAAATNTAGMWNNGNIRQITTAPGAAAPTIASTDYLGNPVAPQFNPDGVTPFTGSLRYVSAFGAVTNIPTKADCSDATVSGAAWDPFRKALDTTGFVTKLNNFMPLPNNYETGDGLNTAGIRWVRTLNGSDNLFGIGDPLTERNQINVKVDHNFSDKERANVSIQYERSGGDDYYRVWPNGFGGSNFRHPLVVTAQMTSTISSNMVNEATFGYSVTGGNNISPFADPTYGAAANTFYNLSANGIPVVPQLGTTPAGGNATNFVNFQFNQPLGNRGIWPAKQYDKTPLTTLADTLSWAHGTHSFKVGFESRLARSLGSSDGGFGNASVQARAIGGDTSFAPIATGSISATGIPGLGGTATTGNNGRLRSMVDYLSGSLGSVTELYFLQSASDTDWQNYSTAKERILDYHQNSYDFFVKDDWKIQKNLTLNLGIRYERYGVPFISKGLTVAPVGGGYSLFGISGHEGFQNWMKPGALVSDPSLLTTLQFVGPGSKNPDVGVWRDDLNNWGPAVGFAWQVPFFGEGKTTVRGGYQITYQGTVQVNTLDGAIGNAPGTTNQQSYAGDGLNPYLDLATAMSTRVPVPVTVQPMQAIPIGTTGVSYTAYDPNYVSPYVQNFTLSVTRSIRSNLTLDVRYVGNMAVKQNKNVNLNTNNWLYNGLKAEFDSIRAGGESPMLDQMFAGINLVGTGFGAIGTTVSGVPQTAALQMRASTTFNTNLANGNYNGVAGSVATFAYTNTFPGNGSLPVIPNGQTVGDALRNSGKFPANFIVANPQFGAATYNTNLGHTNYNSLEVQTTYRPIQGVSWQGTYTWSKNLGTPGSFTNPVDRSYDGYQLIGNNAAHQFRSNGAIDLPMGPNKLLFGNSSGALARVLEGWQTAFIYNLASGVPTTITGQTTLYNNGRPDIVGPFPTDLKGNIWKDGAASGSYFPEGTFATVKDPQCLAIAVSLQTQCTLQAIADGKTGQILLQNAQPGVQGTLGVGTVEIAGTWSLDANIGKKFRISENKSIQVRLDALNILNHPSPVAPNLALSAGTNNTQPFGVFNNKSTNARQFQGQLRFNF